VRVLENTRSGVPVYCLGLDMNRDAEMCGVDTLGVPDEARREVVDELCGGSGFRKSRWDHVRLRGLG